MKSQKLNPVFLGAKNNYRKEFRELIDNVRRDCRDLYIQQEGVAGIVYKELRKRHLNLNFYDITSNFDSRLKGLISIGKIVARIFSLDLQKN